MTTPTTDQPAVPAWLAAAEAAHQEQQLDTAAYERRRAERHADLINARLAEFGIEPIEPAGIDGFGKLRPAKLTDAEFDGDPYYEVRAAWSEDDKAVELHTADWESDRPRLGYVRLLHSLADVAAARRETPKFPAPKRNWRTEAIRAIDGLNVDNLSNADVEALATAIHGNSAAVLHLADIIARTNSTV
jgi:hypothetical protein